MALACASAASSADLAPTATPEEKDYRLFFGNSVNPTPEHGIAVTGNWGAVRLRGRPATGVQYPLRVAPDSGGNEFSYFTPAISGLRLGIGVSPKATAAESATGPGPRRVVRHRPAQNWQFGGSLGGSVGNSALQIGANFGDHPDPACEPGESCKSNDFWDIAVSFRFGAGSVTAAYMESQPSEPGPDDVDRIDILSFNAGYRLAPLVDIYGAIDWVEVIRPGAAVETPFDTRIMFGTSLRF